MKLITISIPPSQLELFRSPTFGRIYHRNWHLVNGVVSQLTMRLGTLFLYTLSLIFLYLSALQLYNLQIAINTLAIASAIPIFQVVFAR